MVQVEIQRCLGRFLFEVVGQTSLAADWLSEEAAGEVDRKNLDGVISEQKTAVQQMKTQIHKNQQNNLVKLSGSATLKLLVIISIPQIIFTAATLTFTPKRFPFSSLNCCHHPVSLFRATDKRNSRSHDLRSHDHQTESSGCEKGRKTENKAEPQRRPSGSEPHTQLGFLIFLIGQDSFLLRAFLS